MASHSPLPQPALSHITGVSQTAGIPVSALPHAFRYQSVKRRRNCSAALSLKAAPCWSRSPEEVLGRFGSAVSPLVGSAENWWSTGESLSFPADVERRGQSPLPPCSCHPLIHDGDTGMVGMCSPSWHWRSRGKYCCNNLPINSRCDLMRVWIHSPGWIFIYLDIAWIKRNAIIFSVSLPHFSKNYF